MAATVNISCNGTVGRPHPVRTAAQYHDKYATSWELTPNFGPEPYGSERKNLRVPGAEPGDDLRMRVVVSCPVPECPVRKPVRWENLHAQLDEARDRGYSVIPIQILTN